MLSTSISAKDAINASFAFTLKNKQGETDSWYLDLKNKAEVGKGIGPQGKPADGEPPCVSLVHKTPARSGKAMRTRTAAPVVLDRKRVFEANDAASNAPFIR